MLMRMRVQLLLTDLYLSQREKAEKEVGFRDIETRGFSMTAYEEFLLFDKDGCIETAWPLLLDFLSEDNPLILLPRESFTYKWHSKFQVYYTHAIYAVVANHRLVRLDMVPVSDLECFCTEEARSHTSSSSLLHSHVIANDVE